MADTWLTIEQAAVTLGLSVRTVNRHISAGKLQSRLFEGRREVLVSVGREADTSLADEAVEPHTVAVTRSSMEGIPPDPIPATAGPGVRSASPEAPKTEHRQHPPSARGQGDEGSDGNGSPTLATGVDSETMLALRDSWSDDRDLLVTAYQRLTHSHEAQVVATRRGALIAWSGVAVMLVGIIGAVGWTTYHLTRTTVERQMADQENRRLREELARKADALDKAVSETNAVREESAKVQQQLSEKIGEERGRAAAEHIRPSTQPTDPLPTPPLSATQPATAPALATQPVGLGPGPSPGAPGSTNVGIAGPERSPVQGVPRDPNLTARPAPVGPGTYPDPRGGRFPAGVGGGGRPD